MLLVESSHGPVYEWSAVCNSEIGSEQNGSYEARGRMGRMRWLLFTATFLFGLSGSQLVAQVDDGLSARTRIGGAPGPPRTFMIVAKGDSASIHRLSAVVVNSNAEWQTLVPMLSDRKDAAIRRPPVDFAIQTVIAVFQGTRGIGGLGIEINEIIEHHSHLVVSTIELVPRPNCTRTPLRAPYEIVAVPKTTKRVEIDTFMQLVACEK